MKLIYEEKVIDGIPLIECLPDNDLPKRLCFINHGFTSNKGDGTYFMLFELAKLGLHVIAVDAYKHGERIEEPMISGPKEKYEKEIFDIVIQTGKDIKHLYETYYKQTYSECIITGISMGGAITFFAGSIIKEAKWLIPLIGFPSFYEFGLSWLLNTSEEASDEAKANFSKYKKEDPLYNLDCYKGKNLLILNGSNDEVVPVTFANQFQRELKALNIANVDYQEFPVGHDVSKDMQQLVYNYLNEIDKP